jgi:hypothetical protein
MTNGNLNVAIDICQHMEGNLRYAPVQSDKLLTAALELTSPKAVPETAAMDTVTVNNI